MGKRIDVDTPNTAPEAASTDGVLKSFTTTISFSKTTNQQPRPFRPAELLRQAIPAVGGWLQIHCRAGEQVIHSQSLIADWLEFSLAAPSLAQPWKPFGSPDVLGNTGEP